MPLPSKSQISDAVENVSSFLTAQLAGYVTENGILGPDHYSGGFCIVFPVSNGNTRKALRVWHTEIENIKERYKYISNDIANSHKHFLLDVDYIPRGLLVGKETLDIVLMDWLDGLSLKHFISKIIDSSDDLSLKIQQLNLLASKLYDVFIGMHQLHFAHGDLQHDNIIIDSIGNIRLIDYDNFYTPSLGDSMYQTTTGYSGYQHPKRLSQSRVLSSEKDDYFAELIIYLSIKAIAADLTLWDIARNDDYALLLTNEDYKDIYKSALFSKIKRLGGELEELCLILEIYLSKNSIEELEPFDVLIEKLSKDPKINKFVTSCGDKIIKSENIKLLWDVENYTQILLNGKDVTTQLSFDEFIENTTDYTLQVINGSKFISKTINVQVFPEPEIYISSSKKKLSKDKNETVTIDWRIQNVDKVQLFRNGDLIYDNCKLKESYKCKIDDDSTFTINARALDRKSIYTKSITLNVYPEATFKFESDKEYVLHNKPFTLTWETKDAKKVELNGLAVSEEGSQTILNSLGKDITYTLSVTDEFETKSKTIRIKTLPIPSIKVSTPCNKFKQKEIIPIKIDWDVQNASNIVLLRNGESVEGEFKLKDSYETDIEVSSTFTIQALALDNETSFSESVFIDVFPEATFTFETDKKYVFPTIPFTLTWETKNAKKVELNGKPVSESGSETFINGIEKDAIYTLSVTDEFEKKTKTIIIKQLPIPRIESINVPLPNLEQTINFSVDLRIPDFKINVAELELSKIELNDSHLKDVDLEKIDSSQIIECIYKVRKQSLWKKIKNMISRIVSRNGK